MTEHITQWSAHKSLVLPDPHWLTPGHYPGLGINWDQYIMVQRERARMDGYRTREEKIEYSEEGRRMKILALKIDKI